MPPGDLITRDGQAEIRGLLLGNGTPYAIEGWTGLGVPDVRHDDQALEGDDGSTGGLDTYGPRTIAASLGISAWDRAALGAARDALAGAFARTSGPRDSVPMVIRLAGAPRLFHVRPRHLDLPWAGIARDGLMLGGAFQVVALDPYAYGTAEVVDTLTIADSASSTSEVVTNAGNGRTWPVLTITGPATDPVVTNLETGRSARFDVTLGSTDVLVVDMQAGTMTLDGNPTWVGAVDYEPFELVPGAQEISYTRTGGGIPSTVDVTFRPAWLGI